MPLSLDKLPTRRDEAWKWTDVRGQVTDAHGGLSAAGLPKFTLPDGVSVSEGEGDDAGTCLLYTSPSPRDLSTSRMPSSA